MNKQYKLSIVLMLIVVLLAFVPNVTATTTGYMDGNNWTGIDKILDSFGYSFLKNNTLLCGANMTCTLNANGSVTISSIAGGVSGMSNPATADLNMNNYSISTAKNVSAKNIGGVIYADQYATIQDALNESRTRGGGIVELPLGTTELSTFNTADGVTITKVLLILPANTTLRGQKGKTILKQAGATNANVMILVTGKNSKIEDITVDFNGDAQTYSGYGTSSYVGGIVGGDINTPADYLSVSNVKVINVHAHDKDPNITAAIGINFFNAPYSTASRIEFDRFDSGMWITQAFEDTVTKYNIENIICTNGMYDYCVNWETGDANVNNVWVNNSKSVIIQGSLPGTGSSNGVFSNLNVKNPTNNLISVGWLAQTNVTIRDWNIQNQSVNLQKGTKASPVKGYNIYVHDLLNASDPMHARGISIQDGYAELYNPTIFNIDSHSLGYIGNSVGIQIHSGGIGTVVGGSINNTYDGAVLIDTGSFGIIRDVAGVPGYNHGNSATAPTAFGAGDTYYNTTSGIQQLYTNSAWDWLLMPSKVFGTGVTNNNNGSITIVDSTYNATYAKGGLPFTITNGTNIIGTTESEDSFTTVYVGTITKILAHSSQTGSINVSFWNATAGNTYINSVVISAGTDASTSLNYAFSDETRIMFNVTSVTDIKKVAITVKTTKS